MSSNKIELKGVAIEIYDEDDSIYPKIPYVFSLHYNHKFDIMFLLPTKIGKKYCSEVHVTPTIFKMIVDEDFTSGVLTEEAPYNVLSKFDITPTYNKKKVTCTMVDKERFRDEMLKINYKDTIGVKQ